MKNTNKEKTGSVFTNRNFNLVFFGALVSELGAVLYSFAVSFYLLKISDNNALLQGTYLAVCGIVLLLFTTVGGVLGDRFDKAKIMYLCDYAKGGIILLATAGMLLFPESGAHTAILFAAGILGNAVSGIFNPAAGALLPHIVEDDKLQQANAYFSVKSSLESIFGIVLAGVLYAALPITTLFFAVGVCYVLSGVSEMFIRCGAVLPADKLTIRSALGDMRDGFVYLKRQKAVMALMAAILFINFFFVPVSGNFIPYFVSVDVAGSASYLFDGLLTPEMWSSVFSVLIGVSTLAGSAILSARAQDNKCGRRTARMLCVIAGIMIALAATYFVLIDRSVSLNAFLLTFSAGLLMIGFILPWINIPVNTALMRLVDRDKLSKVNSILSIMSQGLIPIASVLAGAVLQYLGSSSLLFICAAGFSLAAVYLLFNKSVREI